MNIVASAPEGLEKSLAEEISNLGGFNINTHKILKIISNTLYCSKFYKLINDPILNFDKFKMVEPFQAPWIIWLIRLI